MPGATFRGRFVWHELMTTDTKAAIAFYTKVVGWKAQGWPQDPSYTMLVAKAGPMAGVMAIPEDAKAMGAPPSWLAYISSPDVDATTRLAVELGGRILKEPTDLPDVGRFAVLQDLQGAAFAVFTPAQGGMGDGKPTMGDFAWHELTTTDWQAAFDFYQKLFGWTKTESMDMGSELGLYQMYGWKGTTLGGMWNKPKTMQAPPHWLAYVTVPDTKAAVEKVKQLGGQVLNGPMEVPGGDWMAQCLDPQGVLFAVHSHKPAAKVVEAKVVEAKKPAAKKVAAKKPAAKKAAAKKPAAKKAAAKKRVVKKAAAKKRVVKKAAAKKRVVKRAAAKKRVARKPKRMPRRAKRVVSRKVAKRAKARKKAGAKKRRR
jgi:hypothetical protein